MYFLLCYIERLSPSWSFNQQQAENQARETELDLAKQQSALEGGLARLQTKLKGIETRPSVWELRLNRPGARLGALRRSLVLPLPLRADNRASLKDNPFTPDFCAICQHFL